MKFTKIIAYIGSLIFGIWLSLILILVVVERVILNIGNSLLRSITGISLYFLWLFIGYIFLREFSMYFIRKNRSISSP